MRTVTFFLTVISLTLLNTVVDLPSKAQNRGNSQNCENIEVSSPQPNDSNKPPGSVLQPGQTWSQGGMELTLSKPSFTPNCRNAFLEFNLNLVNNSGSDLVTNINSSDITLQMNGETFSKYNWIGNNYKLTGCGIFRANKFEIRSLKAGENKKFKFIFLGRVDPQAEKVVVQVKKAGRIQNAKWEIPVPR